MPKLAVTMIESIVGSVATTDGHHAVLQARTSDDAVVALGVAREQLAHLIDHCALADLSAQIAWNIAYSLPALIVGTVLGLAAFGRVNDRMFRRVVLSSLLVSGFALL